jgi:hypothetical protein
VLIVIDETEAPIQFVGRIRLDGKERPLRELSIRKLIGEE